MRPRGSYDPHSSAAIVAHRRRWVSEFEWIRASRETALPGDVIPESVLNDFLNAFLNDWPSLTD